MYGVDCDIFFALKSLLNNNPAAFLFCFGIGSIFFFGFLVRLSERPLSRSYLENGTLIVVP